MCGIVGLFFKRAAAAANLGPCLAAMLLEMAERGPDSTGFALYDDSAPHGAFKLTLHAPVAKYSWATFEAELQAAVFPLAAPTRYYGSHAVFTLRCDQNPLFDWLAEHHPKLGAFGFGERIEVFKDVGLPGDRRIDALDARRFRVYRDVEIQRSIDHTVIPSARAASSARSNCARSSGMRRSFMRSSSWA